MINASRRPASIPWWERGVIYQIYPRSFQDSDGDGVGDLAGIEQRLDYLAELGVDAIWLSPIFPSPMADFGYDVADYCGVDPLFGTLDDFDRLLAAAHRRGLKLLLDFVPNHSSDRHPWFVESRSSREHPKRDWYIWRDPGPDGGPPNNWISDFGGSAWEWDEATGQYYLHAFLKEQPDLNWRNPEVRAAMLDVHALLVRPRRRRLPHRRAVAHVQGGGLPDNPANPDYRPEMGEKLKLLQLNSTDQPEVHEIAAEFRALADDYGDRLLVGEIFLPLDELMTYYGDERPGVHLPFNFQLVEAPWDAAALARLIADYEAALPARRLAQLGDRQPRLSAHRRQARRGAGARRGDAAADAARHADAVPGRRARHRRGRDPARPGPRPAGASRAGHRPWPRSIAHAHGMGSLTACRLQQRRALAAAA